MIDYLYYIDIYLFSFFNMHIYLYITLYLKIKERYALMNAVYSHLSRISLPGIDSTLTQL